MQLTITLLAILVLLLQLFKDTKDSKSPVLIVPIYILLLSISVLGYITHTDNEKAQKRLNFANLQFKVLPKVNDYRIEILDNIVTIYNNSAVISNYLSFKQANKDYPELKDIYPWEKVASEGHVLKLKQSMKSLDNLKTIAVNIINLKASHGNQVPEEIYTWAVTTTKIDFNDIQNYINAYNPSPSVYKYLTLLGTGYTKLLIRLNNATHEIEKQSLTSGST